MKMKRALMTAVGVLGCAAMLVACGDGDDGGKPEPPPQEEAFVKLTVDDGNTELNWDGGGKTYSVYRASTRYGEYTLAQSDITDGKFTDDSRFCYYKVCELSGSGEVIEE